MTASNYFSLANMMAMSMWILMIFLPNWKFTKLLMNYKVIPFILSLSYAYYIMRSMGLGGGMDFGSLQSVMALFTEENAVMAGWIHYLAFDLLVGMWMINRNQTIGVHGVVMGICLLSTFMLGPIGFLLYLLFTAIKQNTRS